MEAFDKPNRHFKRVICALLIVAAILFPGHPYIWRITVHHDSGMEKEIFIKLVSCSVSMECVDRDVCTLTTNICHL